MPSMELIGEISTALVALAAASHGVVLALRGVIGACRLMAKWTASPADDALAETAEKGLAKAAEWLVAFQARVPVVKVSRHKS